MTQNNLEILQELFPNTLYPHENGQIYNWEGIPITKKELIDNIKHMANGIIKSNKEFVEKMSEPKKISPYFTSNWISVSNKDEAISQKLSTQWNNSFKFVDIYPYSTCSKVLHYISTGQGKCYYTIMNEDNINRIVKWYIDIINETIPELLEPSFYVIFDNDKTKYWKISCRTGAILYISHCNLNYNIDVSFNKVYHKSGYNLSIKRFFEECKVEPNTVWSWSEDCSWFMKPKGGFNGCSSDSYTLSYIGTINNDN